MKRPPDSQLELPLRFTARQSVGHAHLVLEGKLVSYTVKRSLRRRAISILVDEQGVRVGAPWNAGESAIEALLQRHATWVLRKLDEWHVRRAPTPRWVDGEALMLRGERLILRISAPADGDAVHLRGTELHVAEPTGGAAIGRCVHDWLRTQALGVFAERVHHFRTLAGIEKSPQVLLSNARTRWGSCHVSGRIHLNWRLIQVPSHLLDYVVAHEVAHLIEMNHSKRFWQVVGCMVPDFRARRAELRHDAHRYLLV